MSTISKIDYLRSKIATSYEDGINVKELGDLALELLVLRNDVYRRKEENPTDEEKKEIDKTIEELHELERFIISLYMVSGMQNIDRTYPFFSDFKTRKYSYHKRD
ncbi:MAG: hypothetical protein ACREA3_03425 [Nitrosotalea sp.]